MSAAHEYARTLATKPRRSSIIRRSSKPMPAISAPPPPPSHPLHGERLLQADEAPVELVVRGDHVALVVEPAHALAHRVAHPVPEPRVAVELEDRLRGLA